MFVIVIDGCLDECDHFADAIGYFSSEEETISYLLSEGYKQNAIAEYVKYERKGLSSTSYRAIVKKLNKIK